MPLPDLGTTVRTLLLNGFHLDTARRAPGHNILNVHRYDRFGVLIPYSMAFFDDEASQTASDAFLHAAKYEVRCPLLVASSAPRGINVLAPDRFFSILGGTVDDALIRHAKLSDRLDLLGRNNTPPGETGDPEELLEQSVAACLQFLIGQRAHRWGAERRFESLPDGVLPGSDALVLLYDAKSYTDPYEVTADDIRRFADYVDVFNSRYAAFLNPVYAFLVVAGDFSQNDGQRASRSGELYSRCRAPLCFVRARVLGEIVEHVRQTPELRASVDWKRLFAAHTLSLASLKDQTRRLAKDGVRPID